MKNILLFTCLFMTGMVVGQSEAYFTQFWNAQQMTNPAKTGKEFQHEAHVMDRFWNSPTIYYNSFMMSYGTRINKFNSGIGFSFTREDIYYESENKVRIQYAYHLTFKEKHQLSVGISAGLHQFDNHKLSFFSYDSNHQVTDTINGGRGTGFTIDAGLHYKINRLNIGLSVTQLNQPIIRTGDLAIKDYLNTFSFISYTFGKESGFQVRPQFQYSQMHKFLSLNFNTMFILKNTYALGLNVRSRSSFGMLVGYTFREKLNLSYSYETTVSKLNNSVSAGNHEIHLGLTLGKK